MGSGERARQDLFHQQLWLVAATGVMSRADSQIFRAGVVAGTSGWSLPASLAVVCLAAAPTLEGLWRLWHEDENFAGLMLVPLMCVFVLIRRRKDLARIEGKPVWGLLGMGLFSVAGMVVLSGQGYIRVAALLLVLNLLIVCIGVMGFAAMKVLLGPLLFLVLMVPPWQQGMDFLIVNLQGLFASVIEFLSPVLTAGAVERDGFAFWFSGLDYPMVIARECSGIRSLLGFVVVSVFLAVLDKHKLRGAVGLLAGGVGVALALNLGRIMVTMQLRLHGLEEYSLGGWHGNLGKVVFVLGYLVLSRLSRFLRQG